VIVLALDIATTTGWAHDDATGQKPLSGTFRAPRPAGLSEEGLEYGRTFAAFRKWLVDFIGVVKPGTLAFEAPLQIVQGHRAKVSTNQSAIRILFGLAAIAEMTATECNLRPYECNVQTVKRHFTGSGHADKDAMMARCRQLGWPAQDHNGADACGVWCLVKGLQDPSWRPAMGPLFQRNVA
jgi:hypothetical protein